MMAVNASDADLSHALKLLAHAHERELSQLQSLTLLSRLQRSSPCSSDVYGCGPRTKARRGANVVEVNEPAIRSMSSSNCSADMELGTDTRTHAIVSADSEIVKRHDSHTGAAASMSPSTLGRRGRSVGARRNAFVSVDSEVESRHGPQPVSIASILASLKEILTTMVQCKASWAERCSPCGATFSMEETTEDCAAREGMTGDFADGEVYDRHTLLSVSTQAPSSASTKVLSSVCSSRTLDLDFIVQSFSINTSDDE